MIDRVGSALRLLREASGLSQRQLALRCREAASQAGEGGRVTQGMVSQWERGEQLPRLVSLWAVLDAQGYSFEQLGRALALVAPREQAADDAAADDAASERARRAFERETLARFESYEKRLRLLETSRRGDRR